MMSWKKDTLLPTRFALGPVWRIAFPSRFQRDGLVCDLFILSSTDAASTTRVRLANVHLDSLAINPSHRPQQLSIVSSFLQSAGCGLVAGDFNPNLDEDAVLVDTNGLTDALGSSASRGTWGYMGADGKQRFPPNRMDRVALLGLKACGIEMLEARRVEQDIESQLPNPSRLGLQLRSGAITTGCFALLPLGGEQ